MKYIYILSLLSLPFNNAFSYVACSTTIECTTGEVAPDSTFSYCSMGSDEGSAMYYSTYGCITPTSSSDAATTDNSSNKDKRNRH